MQKLEIYFWHCGRLAVCRRQAAELSASRASRRVKVCDRRMGEPWWFGVSRAQRFPHQKGAVLEAKGNLMHLGIISSAYCGWFNSLQTGNQRFAITQSSLCVFLSAQQPQVMSLKTPIELSNKIGASFSIIIG